MKFIPYSVKTKDFDTRGILSMVATANGGQNGIRTDEMRKRVRILDALDAQDKDGPGLTIEDADHELLVRLINDYPFGVASRDLLKVIDAVIEAKAPQPVAPEAEKAAA